MSAPLRRLQEAPVTFRTFDVYTIRAAAAINDGRGGRLLAKHSETRVVEIGPQVTTVKIWESQRDFEEGMWETQLARFWTTSPNKFGTIVKGQPQIIPYPRWRNMLNGKYFPWDPRPRPSADRRPKRKRSTPTA